MSKLPSELRAVPEEQFVLLMRAVFDLALAHTHDHDAAMETTSESLYRLTTDKRWNPEERPLREHFLALVAPCYRELRYGSLEEKAACRFYAQAQGKASGSAEDLAVLIEDQPDLEASDEVRPRLAAEVWARIAHDEGAMALARVWEQHGSALKSGQIAALLGVPVAEVYRATRVVRYQADKAKASRLRSDGKTLRRNAAKGGVS
jgi:hypothetical protein